MNPYRAVSTSVVTPLAVAGADRRALPDGGRPQRRALAGGSTARSRGPAGLVGVRGGLAGVGVRGRALQQLPHHPGHGGPVGSGDRQCSDLQHLRAADAVRRRRRGWMVTSLLVVTGAPLYGLAGLFSGEPLTVLTAITVATGPSPCVRRRGTSWARRRPDCRVGSAAGELAVCWPVRTGGLRAEPGDLVVLVVGEVALVPEPRRPRPRRCPPRPGCGWRPGPGTTDRGRSPLRSPETRAARPPATAGSPRPGRWSARRAAAGCRPSSGSVARFSRLRSPPDSTPASFCWSGPLKPNDAT